jgi:hypothetical protein
MYSLVTQTPASSRRLRKIMALGVVGSYVLLTGFAACGRRETIYPPEPPISYTGDASAPTVALDSGSEPSASNPPLPLDPATLASMSARLDARARAAGAGRKEGEPIGAVLREGQELEHSLTFEPSRCYSVFASGEGGISELDIRIVAKAPLPLPQPGPIISVDNTTGPEAVITPCWKSLIPALVPAFITVKATRGQGSVAAQVYSK